MSLLALVAVLWRRATYRTATPPHPHAAAGLTLLRGRRPHDELEWR